MNVLTTKELSLGIIDLFQAEGRSDFHVSPETQIVWQHSSEIENRVNLTEMLRQGETDEFCNKLDLIPLIDKKDNLPAFARYIVDIMHFEMIIEKALQGPIVDIFSFGPFPYLIEDGCDDVKRNLKSAGFKFTGVIGADNRFSKEIYRVVQDRTTSLSIIAKSEVTRGDGYAARRAAAKEVNVFLEKPESFVTELRKLIMQAMDRVGINLSHKDTAPMLTKARRAIKNTTAPSIKLKVINNKEPEAPLSKNSAVNIPAEVKATNVEPVAVVVTTKIVAKSPLLETSAVNTPAKVKATNIEPVAVVVTPKIVVKAPLLETSAVNIPAKVKATNVEPGSVIEHPEVSLEEDESIKAWHENQIAIKKAAEPYAGDDAVPYLANFIGNAETRRHFMSFLKSVQINESGNDSVITTAEEMSRSNLFITSNASGITFDDKDEGQQDTVTHLSQMIEDIVFDMMLEDKPFTNAQVASRIMKDMQDNGLECVIMHSPNLDETNQPLSLLDINRDAYVAPVIVNEKDDVGRSKAYSNSISASRY